MRHLKESHCRYSYERDYKEARYLAIGDLLRGVSEATVLRRYRFRAMALAAWKRAGIINQDWIDDYEADQWEHRRNYARRHYFTFWLANDRNTSGTAKQFRVSKKMIYNWLREDKEKLWGDTAEGKDAMAWQEGKRLLAEAKRLLRTNRQTHNANLP